MKDSSKWKELKKRRCSKEIEITLESIDKNNQPDQSDLLYGHMLPDLS